MAMKCYSRDFKMTGSWHRFLQGGKITLDWFRGCLMAGMAPELPGFLGWWVCFIRWGLGNVRSARNRLSVKVQVVSPARGSSRCLSGLMEIPFGYTFLDLGTSQAKKNNRGGLRKGSNIWFLFPCDRALKEGFLYLLFHNTCVSVIALLETRTTWRYFYTEHESS